MTLEKTKNYIQKPQISPMSLVVLITQIALNIATSDNPYLMGFQVVLSVLLVLSGVKMTDVKELMKRLKTVITDKSKTLTQKFTEVFDIVITGCATLGVIQEEMNLYPVEYFIKKTEPTRGEKLDDLKKEFLETTPEKEIMASNRKGTLENKKKK